MSEDNGKYTPTPGDKIDVLPIDEHAVLKADLMQELSDMKQFIIMQSGGHIRKQLFELPEQIKIQSLRVAELTNHTEALRLSLVNSKNQVLELVLSATEDGKSKFSNDKARNLAVEQLLREDKLYLDSIDELSRKEYELRKEEIELEHLQNQFRAYLAVAGMQGVR